MRTERVGRLIARARSLIGIARYERSANRAAAPDLVNCVTFTAYVYAVAGLELPLKQQNELGTGVELDERHTGDLVFVFGATVYGSPGHVGIATDQGTVIHADPLAGTVVESSIDDFLADGKKWKVRRLVE